MKEGAMVYTVYMLQCVSGRLYIGHTNDLDRRLAEHQNGESQYTARWRPVTLIWSETYPSQHDAFHRERQVKRWSRGKKLALARGDWESLRELSRCRSESEAE